MEFMETAGRFVDPVAIAIVFGGAFGVAVLRSTRADIAAAFGALRQLLRADPAADALAARLAIGRIEAIAELRTIACADRVKTTGLFLRRAAVHLADAKTATGFALWAEDEMAGMRARHERAAGVWRAIADAAPAMGMVGTVVALVRMFSVMDDVASLGPAMAIAMLTTLYGLILGNAIAGPIAARLERLSEEEAAWRGWALNRMTLLAQAELDGGPARVPSLRVVA
ncbi:MAG TPA: MotA/TolQ/ExbB proton channel family protein [Sphingomonas sp.]|jgi:chemotaxis protein MotA|uniref:motility protein A n=1 Tax=Sphingomonas sp. TaxID=28214 RepID=UPI002ED8E076